jgi:hypothetical protein
MVEGVTWVGMDVHQEQIVVAILEGWQRDARRAESRREDPQRLSFAAFGWDNDGLTARLDAHADR